MLPAYDPQSDQQAEIWQSDAKRADYAQLCNAFYAREITRVASLADEQRLRRTLSSLPYYIERAASHIINGDIPLTLDSQNGCWLDKQKASPPKFDAQASHNFFQANAKTGLIVPILINCPDQTRLRIDSIDQVSDNKLHCNELGWFTFEGEPIDEQYARLLKPNKVLMSAACSGHQWRFNKRSTPRVLSLRGMLLAANINWQNFKQPKIQVK